MLARLATHGNTVLYLNASSEPRSFFGPVGDKADFVSVCSPVVERATFDRVFVQLM